MKARLFHILLTYLIAGVWLINGLICKVMSAVPRHQEIVERILGASHSKTLTNLIGISEILMAIWVFSNFKTKLNAVVQIVVVTFMNLLEFILVPELLLWGRFNLFFALLFIGTIYYREFILNKKLNLQSAQ